MKRIRLIPILSIIGNKLVKTVKFKNPNYLGDPVNAIKVFNDKEVDEIAITDIRASKENSSINFELIKEMASECFMPMAYGGGIKKLDEIKMLFSIGVEKVIVNSSIEDNYQLITEAASIYGNQSIVASLDIRKNIFGHYVSTKSSNSIKRKIPFMTHIKNLEHAGIGELLINNIDRDGTFNGIDLSLTKLICDSVSVPVISAGGLNSIDNIVDCINIGNASAVGGGAFFSYTNKNVNSILINYPGQNVLKEMVYKKII